VTQSSDTFWVHASSTCVRAQAFLQSSNTGSGASLRPKVCETIRAHSFGREGRRHALLIHSLGQNQHALGTKFPIRVILSDLGGIYSSTTTFPMDVSSATYGASFSVTTTLHRSNRYQPRNCFPATEAVEFGDRQRKSGLARMDLVGWVGEELAGARNNGSGMLSLGKGKGTLHCSTLVVSRCRAPPSLPLPPARYEVERRFTQNPPKWLRRKKCSQDE
jgi:hypothetical protein